MFSSVKKITGTPITWFFWTLNEIIFIDGFREAGGGRAGKGGESSRTGDAGSAP